MCCAVLSSPLTKTEIKSSWPTFVWQTTSRKYPFWGEITSDSITTWVARWIPLLTQIWTCNYKPSQRTAKNLAVQPGVSPGPGLFLYGRCSQMFISICMQVFFLSCPRPPERRLATLLPELSAQLGEGFLSSPRSSRQFRVTVRAERRRSRRQAPLPFVR